MARWTLVSLMAVGLVALFAASPALAQGNGFGHGVGGFVDENGDGFNDLAPDADGDGIPNGLDPDYQPPQDGTGAQFGHRANGASMATDGYAAWFRYLLAPRCVLAGDPFAFGMTLNGAGRGHGWGPGDGTGFGGDGPHDGTGFGPGGTTGNHGGMNLDGPENGNGNGNGRRGGR